MRNILNLFKLKVEYSFDIIYIGYVKVLIVDYINFSQINCLIKYCSVVRGILLIYDYLDELYSLDDNILDLDKLIIVIIFKKIH